MQRGGQQKAAEVTQLVNQITFLAYSPRTKSLLYTVRFFNHKNLAGIDQQKGNKGDTATHKTKYKSEPNVIT